MNITVYLGALEGNDPMLAEAVRELGMWIGNSGNTLVYGGSKTGLMGMLAESTLSSGGNVIGVEPQFFIDKEFQYDGLTELIITKDMSERKNKEIAEVMSKVSLKQLDAPCILYNLNGYYNSLKDLLDHMICKGLSSKERQAGIYFADNIEGIKQILKDNSGI